MIRTFAGHDRDLRGQLEADKENKRQLLHEPIQQMFQVICWFNDESVLHAPFECHDFYLRLTGAWGPTRASTPSRSSALLSLLTVASIHFTIFLQSPL